MTRAKLMLLGMLAVIAFTAMLATHSACAATPPTPTSAKSVTRTAEKGPVKLEVTIDRDELYAPQTAKLTIAIEHEAGVEIAPPDIKDTFGDFLVKEKLEPTSQTSGPVRRDQWQYTLEGVMPGRHEIPAIKLNFEDPREKADGSHERVKDSVGTQPIPVNVHVQLADVKGPAVLAIPPIYALLFWALGLIGVVVIVILLARFNRRKSGVARPVAARIIPAHEWALAQLDKLIAERLVERGLVQEFYYRINALLRAYIERRFRLHAAEQTTEEFIRALQFTHELAEEHKTVLRRFVSACDPVKYAKQQPEPGELDWVQTAARDFITQTREWPIPASEQSKQGAAA